MLEGDDGTRRGDRLTEVYAWVAIDPKDNCEGILVGQVEGLTFPLIAGDTERLKDFRPLAEAAHKISGQTLKLVRFTTREEIETLG